MSDRCPWCATPQPASPGPRFHVTRCPSCGVGVTRPQPDDLALEAAYADWYRPDEGRFSGPGDLVLQRTRATLARRIDKVAPPGRVLDVGAGDGGLVAALRARGRDALGLERAARSEHVVDGTVHDADDGWAAIVFWHSLEHLTDAGAAFDAAAAKLAPGGVLLIAVPNLQSPQARRFGARWLALDLPRHVVHLDPAAITARAAERGLRAQRVSAWRGGQIAFGWLHGLVARLPGTPDLYDAIRRPEARQRPMRTGTRAAVLTAGAVLLPVAAAAAAGEVLSGHAGTTYLELRRPR
jgi:SAM-dependent methyltransferase